MPRFAVAFQCLCLAKGCILLLLLNIYVVVVLWGWPGPRNKNLIHCKFWIILLAESVCSELNEISVGGSAYDHVVNYRLYLNACLVGSAEGCMVILYSVTHYSVNALFSHLNDYFEYALACYKILQTCVCEKPIFLWESVWFGAFPLWCCPHASVPAFLTLLACHLLGEMEASDCYFCPCFKLILQKLFSKVF